MGEFRNLKEIYSDNKAINKNISDYSNKYIRCNYYICISLEIKGDKYIIKVDEFKLINLRNIIYFYTMFCNNNNSKYIFSLYKLKI